MRPTKCRSCGAEIEFVRLSSGKWNPVDPKRLTIVTDAGLVVSGRVSHFATCPNADQHRRRNPSGQAHARKPREASPSDPADAS